LTINLFRTSGRKEIPIIPVDNTGHGGDILLLSMTEADEQFRGFIVRNNPNTGPPGRDFVPVRQVTDETSALFKVFGADCL